MTQTDILDERKGFITCNGKDGGTVQCGRDSVAGSVSQRACVYCGSRVVLNPITDAGHIVHGPIGCASYTWDIRGSLSSGGDLYRNSFSTDLREKDVIFGGERKLTAAIDEIMAAHAPKVIFIYATCIVGVIGDDLQAVARQAERKHGIRVIPVQSSGFAGNKSMGYKAACNALLDLMENPLPAHAAGSADSAESAPSMSTASVGTAQSAAAASAGTVQSAATASVGTAQSTAAASAEIATSQQNRRDRAEALRAAKPRKTVNFLGDFNLAGEIWIVTQYLREMGVEITARITGDSTAGEIGQAPTADLNIVQCAGSMVYLANEMEARYGIPSIKVSFYGLDDIRSSLLAIAAELKDPEVARKTRELIAREEAAIAPELEALRGRLRGRNAAIYVGGGFKAISLIRQFRDLGIRTVMVGTQTGRADEYEVLRSISDEGTVILDDTNPSELEKYLRERGADMLVGGVKERPLAAKLGVAFVDHNHERKHPLCGYAGTVNFAKEIDLTVNSPVWRFIRREKEGRTA